MLYRMQIVDHGEGSGRIFDDSVCYKSIAFQELMVADHSKLYVISLQYTRLLHPLNVEKVLKFMCSENVLNLMLLEYYDCIILIVKILWNFYSIK